ncbi:MAG: 4'-phosphopantetheinyl transferase superfamily protein [Planctomycetia bacterium]|nr:4'-phosphopantetheinyl transferase superfamily protein [Planctomycetia bacterium]
MIDFIPLSKERNGFRIETEDFLLLGVEQDDLDESLSSPNVQSLAGRSLLIRCLKDRNRFREYPVYRFGPWKKPYLENYSDLFFNIGHCREAVVCVLSEKEIGIDIEQVQAIESEVMRSVLNDEEIAAVRSASDPNREFIRYWTLKESLLKFRGTGLAGDFNGDLKDLLSDSTCRFNGYSGKNWEIAVCRNE